MNPNEPTNQPGSTEPTNPPAEPTTAIQPSTEPTPVTPADPTPVATQPNPSQPIAKSSNKVLIILVSVIGGLIVIAGIVLAVVLLTAKKDDTPSNNRNSSIVDSDADKSKKDSDQTKKDSDDTIAVTPTTGYEKEMFCKVTNINDNAIDMTMRIYFDKQGSASKLVYEYEFTNGQKMTQDMLPTLKSSLENGMTQYSITVAAEITSSGAARLTVTDKSGQKITLSDLGYGGNDYDSVKKSFAQECSTYNGVFSE